MARTCFKEWHEGIFTRSIKDDDKWGNAPADYERDLTTANKLFVDDNGNSHKLGDIFRISTPDNTLLVYIYSGYDSYCVKVSDPDQKKIVLDYLNQNKCNK